VIEDLKIKNIARIAETDSAFADIVFFYKFHLLTFTYSDCKNYRSSMKLYMLVNIVVTGNTKYRKGPQNTAQDHK